ncbi:hypothetical protein ACFVGY_30720 [Streptomyces sp. NPDC127106]|uniref:hypothetical protein n=1 Tax=Streptomyces sp. NPDC127106 TaxID=3345360 RepID=UPI00362AE24C
MTTDILDTLRKKAERSKEQAEKDNAALLAEAVAQAITSDEYGHLSAVARKAGIAAQYLRDLVEKQHPGWLAEAADNRKARKEAAAKGKSSRAAA